MTKKPTKKGKKAKSNNVEIADEAKTKAALESIMQLRDQFLKMNDGCTKTALLAACELLEIQAIEIAFFKHSSIAGFNRGLTADHAVKAMKG